MSKTDTSAESTHFGYRTVPADEKAGLVRGVFDSVANRYEDTEDDGDFAFGPHDVAVGADGRVYVAVGGPGNALDRARCSR